MKPLRIAVVGAGRLGGFHAQKLAANQRVELVAVVDPDSAQRDRVAQQCNTQSLPDYRKLLEQRALDAAVVAAPTKLHHAIASDLLGEGVHVMVEKPICTTRAEANDLVDLAERKGLVLQVGHVERFNPAFVKATAHTPSPKYIEAVRSSGFTFRSTDVGVVLDLMIHDIDLVLSLVRSPLRRVEALGLSVLGGHEDVANARLEFESGCIATLSASRVSYDPSRRMHVWSTRAFAGIDFASRTTNVVQPSETLLRRKFDVDSLSPDEVEHYKQHLTEEHLPLETEQFEAVDALALEAEDFVDAILSPRAPRVSGAAGRDALVVAEEILAKIHTHAWDDSVDGPVGPMGVPRRRVIPAPHFAVTPVEAPMVRKEAG